MKKTLLMAAAALAAGVISSQAGVYSQNVVGYVNTTLPLGYSLISNPLSSGVTNGLNEIFSSIPDNTTFLVWTGTGYKYFDYDTTLGINADGSAWYDSNLNEAYPPAIPPGIGFFINPGKAMTNAFAGTVVGVNASTNITSLPLGYSLLGSALPVGGALTNAAVNFPFSDNTTFLIWTGTGYAYYDFDRTLGINADGSPWYDSNLNEAQVPNLNVGQAVFINPGVATNWVQNIQL